MRSLLMISVGLTALAAAAPAIAAPAVEDHAIDLNEPVRVAPVTVVGTRTERRVDEVPASVSVITAEAIETNLVTDIKDLIRFEPGVSVPTSPARFSAALSGAGRDGNSGFTIRGMGGNRVLIVQDGVRVPDGFAFGAQSVGRGGYNDLDLVKSVEILRGPASALYGSDGIAGAVSFTSKDPSDFIEAGRNFGARARVGYNSADEGWTEGLALAGRSGAFSGLLAYTRRDAQETENMAETGGVGAARTQPNPQDFASNAVLAKLVWDVNDHHTLRLTYDHFDQEMDGEALSSYSATVVGLTAHDETQRDRVSLDWRFDDVLGLDSGSVAAFWQDSTTRQFTYEDRTPAVDRTRDVTFDNAVWGLAAQGSKSLGGEAVRHRITVGADWSRTTQEGVRDGTVPPMGEPFPARPFPKTEFDLAGLFIQDEIDLLGGRLSIIPALRYDWYELTPKKDALFPAAAEKQSDSRLSPKIGAIYWADDHFGVFANYAQGFKAPSPMQVNNFFANPVFGYESIPNPDLKPETSESIEGGFRFRNLDLFGGSLSLQTTAFRTEYDDFINQVVVRGTGRPGVDPLIYQYVNLTTVKIWGLEARGDIHWDNGFSTIVAASFADGEQETEGERGALTSVDPIKLVGGLNYAAPSGVWGGSATVTWSDKKSNHECGGGLCWPGERFTLLDVTAYWNVAERATLRAGVFNVFDEKYAWWSDVRGLNRPAVGASPGTLDAFTQPGRNVGVSLSVRL
ncbi:TonB-dependent hemoglobin/transferrin/lactoferrin family receptor [Brevundimonas diminuta]|uniref:TonB-dependent hemoglobin/transferrin/lactoferrin family receptor n=1 Tax=Brevundimonas diminuta TaxID=293 RepID=UPI000B4E7671|nr:TonB-dependent hemoglobin/transferrin/lactoferrin family receptor [Brevundimonas diminuta]OWR17078.1 TonB-dependent receptor [Brevundimonas diminuta]WQE44894.1 TonB-dependent hemoglobin/transferrin/lactoferrin family receptor [Brevundimonas diminuta]